MYTFIRHYFKPVLYILGLLIITFSCQKDDSLQFTESSIEAKKDIRATIQSWSHLKDKKKALANRVADINQLNAVNRETTSSTYGFTISDSRVQIIEQDGFTTYTFFAYREDIDFSVLENYMFKEFDDGSYSQFLLTYTNCSFNEDGVIICDNNDLIIESINDTDLLFSRGCGPEFIDVTTENVCYGIGCNGGGNHMPGDNDFNNCVCSTDVNCDIGYDYCYDRDIFHFKDCSGGTYTTTNSDGDPNTGGQGGGSNTTNPPPPNTTIGVPFSLYEFLAEECLNEGYNPNSLNNTVVPIDLSSYNLTPAQAQDIFNYLNIENGCSEEAKEFVNEYLDITEEIPDAIFERFEELLDFLEDDEWALIQDCAEQNGLNTADYLELYNLPFPEECTSRLNSLGEDYYLQPIGDGNVPLANIDYYSVEITEYPDFNNDGIDDSPEEIYNKFREKFTLLASGEKDNFESECDVPFDNDDIIDIWWQFNPLSDSDSNLFTSIDPISSIMLIDAGANNPVVSANADLGAIIVSDFTSNNWTISTIHTPETETQPFSGNRQWGWIINQSGNLELFTRAIDVARVADIFLERPATWFGSDIECQQETYYDIADATWQNMQDEIKIWIESEGDGLANINTPIAVHIDKEKIVEILTTNGSIAEILSNCN